MGFARGCNKFEVFILPKAIKSSVFIISTGILQFLSMSKFGFEFKVEEKLKTSDQCDIVCQLLGPLLDCCRDAPGMKCTTDSRHYDPI